MRRLLLCSRPTLFVLGLGPVSAFLVILANQLDHVGDQAIALAWAGCGLAAVMLALTALVTLLKKTGGEDALTVEDDGRERCLFDSAGCAMLVLHPVTGIVRDVNPAAEEFYGRPRTTLVGKPLTDLSPTDQANACRAAARIAGEASGSTRLSQTTAGGTVRDVELYWHPVMLDRYGLVNVVVIDVTEMIRLGRALLEAKLHAEDADRAKSNFLAAVSHELRTPLNVILGFSEIVASRLTDPSSREECAEYLTFIQHGGNQLLRLVDNMLRLASFDAVRELPNPRWFDVAQLLDLVRSLFEVAIVQKDLTVTVDVPLRPLPVLADDRILRLMLTHLLDNAVKFTPRRGRVSVTARVAEDGVLCLTIADSGIGIPESELARVCRPFEQFSNPYVASGGGIGLGLALVDRYAALVGGAMQITSRPGDGTQVDLRLPLPAELGSEPGAEVEQAAPVDGHAAERFYPAPG